MKVVLPVGVTRSQKPLISAPQNSGAPLPTCLAPLPMFAFANLNCDIPRNLLISM
jgi:hypothetical protein